MLFDGVVQPGDLLDWNNPINFNHPLNRGLIADYSLVSGLSSIKNIADNNFPAIATSAYHSGQGYTLNGYQVGPCECLPIPINSVRTGYAAGTYLFFGSLASKITTAGTFSAFVRKKNPVPATYIGAWTLGNSGLTTLYPHSDGNVYDDSFGTSRGSFAPIVDTSKWHHLIITADSTSRRYYQNGKLAASNSPGTFGPNTYLQIGDTSNSRPMEGDIAAICFYNRTFSANEAAWLHEEQRAGNPSRWNWKRSRSSAVSSGPIARKVPFHLLFSGAM